MTLSTTATRRAVLAALIAATAVYDANYVHLYQSAHAFSNDDVIATLVAIECTFGGYASVGPLVWGTIADQADGSAICFSQLCTFIATDAVTPQDAYGYWTSFDTGGPPVVPTTLTGQLPFVTQQPARDNHDAIYVQPTLVY